jgi:hypothetical protein
MKGSKFEENLRNNGPGKVSIEDTTFPAFETFKTIPKTTPSVMEIRYFEVSLLSHLLNACRSMRGAREWKCAKQMQT